MRPLLPAIVCGYVSDHHDFEIQVCVPINLLSAVKSLAMIIGFLVSFVSLIICLTHFEVQLLEYNLCFKNP